MKRYGGLQWQVLGMAISLAILATLLTSWLAYTHFRNSLTDDLHQKAVDVGESVSALVAKAVGYGEPFAGLAGMGDYLASVRKGNPEILYLAVTDDSGAILYQAGEALPAGAADYLRRFPKEPATGYRAVGERFLDTAVAIDSGGKRLGWLHVGQDAAYVKKQFEDIGLDVATVVVVTSLMAFELLMFVVAFKVTAPLASVGEFFERVRGGDCSQYLTVQFPDEIGRVGTLLNQGLSRVNHAYAGLIQKVESARARFGEQAVQASLGPSFEKLQQRFSFGGTDPGNAVAAQRPSYIRWPFFLLIFSDSLSLSFFPNFVSQLYEPVGWMSREVAIGLPISIFMFVWAFSLPIGGRWSERVGHRRAFVAGAAVTALGLVLTATAHSMLELILWRSLTAVGYGTVFITVQGYITAYTPTVHRTKGMAMFFSGFFAGSLCGAAIGGILADRIGYSPTFFLSAFMGLAAVFFTLRFMPAAAPAAQSKGGFKWSDFKILLANKSFLAVTFLSAIPSKIALTGFLYYTVPLFIRYEGGSQSMAGRGLMAYGLAIIVFSPLIAQMVDRSGSRSPYVVMGSVLSGLALLLLHFFEGIGAVIVCVAFLGIAHATAGPSQTTLVTELCKEECEKLGVGVVIGLFRLVERIGNISGPLIAGGLIAVYGFSGAFLGIGTLILALACVLAWYLRPRRPDLARAAA